MSDIMDFNNQTIEINAPPENANKNNESSSIKNEDTVTPINNKSINNTSHNNAIQRDVVIINSLNDSNNMQTSFETLNKTWIDKFFCCFKIFKRYFQLTSQDFLLRLLNSLIPFNNKFQNLIKLKPDLYGPIWIYSSLILTISATGSLTRTLQGNNNKNFFQEFVPIAGVVIYGVGFGLPLLITFLMKIFGTSLSFVSVICTYGYSFSIFLPISIICVIQLDALQWVALIYAIFSSTSLLVVNYYRQMGDFSKSKKILIIAIVLIFQFGLLLFFKLYFFRRFSDEVMGENIEIIDNGTKFDNNTRTNTNINTNIFDNKDNYVNDTNINTDNLNSSMNATIL
jgi:hypothetical protein